MIYHSLYRLKVAAFDYGEKCKWMAKECEGLSGREISKMAVAWQAAAYASPDGTLTEKMVEERVRDAMKAHNLKQDWAGNVSPAAAAARLHSALAGAHALTSGDPPYAIAGAASSQSSAPIAKDDDTKTIEGYAALSEFVPGYKKAAPAPKPASSSSPAAAPQTKNRT